jgi:succinoglycan biosynthesis transport protein ExoP
LVTDQAAASSEFAGTLRALRRRWWLVPTCWVIVVATAAVFSFTAQKQYSASSGLLFRDPGFDQKLFGTTFLAPNKDPAREAATNVKLVSLDIVAERTAPAFPGLTAADVSSKIKAAAEGQSDVVSVTATDPDPVRARRLANEFAQQYIAFRRNSDRAKIRGAQALVQQRIATLTPGQRLNAEGRSLSERADQLQVLASLQTGNAELVQLAQTPTSPSSPRVKRNLFFAAVLGLLLGVAAALLLHRLDRRLREPDELEEAFGLPVIGAIPRSTAFARGKTHIVPDEIDIAHGEAEAFRLLRARMRYFNVDREVRTVLIVSAVPAEGKTTVAVHLAAAAASSGAKALLLEADLRRPAVSQRVGSVASVGLAEVLTHGAELPDVLREISIQSGSADPAADHASFDLITAGFPPPNPHELIESKRMAELLQELSLDYDLVVIDTPPLLSVSDAIPLIGRVDGVLIVSRLGATTSDAARRLASELKGLNAPVLGIVANGLRTRAQAYYYGYEPERARAPA